MQLLMSMPGGSELIIIIIILCILIFAIVYFLKYLEQKKQVRKLTEEREDVMKKLIDKLDQKK